MTFEKYIDESIRSKFEFHNYGHALEMNHLFLKNSMMFLYPYGWREIRISGDLTVKKYPRQSVQRRGRFADIPYETEMIEGYIDGHNIDFLKNRVAFDLEWNSKDQTFDRDLLAMRTYFDCGLIDVGVIVTRSEELNDIFRKEKDNMGNSLIRKYGASTTWIGKLIYRLDSGRNGGCPILAIGIRKECVEGYD